MAVNSIANAAFIYIYIYISKLTLNWFVTKLISEYTDYWRAGLLRGLHEQSKLARLLFLPYVFYCHRRYDFHTTHVSSVVLHHKGSEFFLSFIDRLARAIKADSPKSSFWVLWAFTLELYWIETVFDVTVFTNGYLVYQMYILGESYSIGRWAFGWKSVLHRICNNRHRR